MHDDIVYMAASFQGRNVRLENNNGSNNGRFDPNQLIIIALIIIALIIIVLFGILAIMKSGPGWVLF